VDNFLYCQIIFFKYEIVLHELLSYSEKNPAPRIKTINTVGIKRCKYLQHVRSVSSKYLESDVR
jgi:hypothetical protein